MNSARIVVVYLATKWKKNPHSKQQSNVGNENVECDAYWFILVFDLSKLTYLQWAWGLADEHCRRQSGQGWQDQGERGRDGTSLVPCQATPREGAFEISDTVSSFYAGASSVRKELIGHLQLNLVITYRNMNTRDGLLFYDKQNYLFPERLLPCHARPLHPRRKAPGGADGELIFALIW